MSVRAGERLGIHTELFYVAADRRFLMNVGESDGDTSRPGESADAPDQLDRGAGQHDASPRTRRVTATPRAGS